MKAYQHLSIKQERKRHQLLGVTQRYAYDEYEKVIYTKIIIN